MKKLIASILGLAALGLGAQAQVTLNIDAGNRGPEISSRHYGIFFEEINHAGDGGLYAELVRNRSFEDAGTATSWSAVNSATMKIVTDDLLNEAQNRALEVTFPAANSGVRNQGFWGMNIVKDTPYKLSFWMKSVGGFSGTITAQLQTAAGVALGEAVATKESSSNGWDKYTAQITATGSDEKGFLALISDKAGKAVFDVVSLFPPTYKNRPNGCRPDLAQMLADMKPAFMRFPGGCFVEGTFRGDLTNRFEWKKTIGPIETRPGHENVNWNYRVSDGLGFHEMLQLAEDLNAEPLFVVNIGMGHGWMENFQTGLDPYIQEALDAIEYCNGSVDTKWGAVRAANGHPEPFNLRLLEIGNENYNFSSNNNSDQSDHYAERYKKFYDAIRPIYPEITLIGNVEAWGTDNPSWRNPYPVDVVDEHYYRNPSWFESNYAKYDTYPRNSHKIYVGEYAVTSNFGTTGNLNAALGEAVYMMGMENNSDVCVMNSYAPIFVNENDQCWMPDMIRFTSAQAYGTPSYYVQMLMPNNVGKVNVKRTEQGNSNIASNHIGLSTWVTSATFDNIKVTDPQGNVLLADDFTTDSGLWHANGGTWSIANGVLAQTDQGMEGKVIYNSTEIGDYYTIELDATKVAGREGFLIAFKYGDENNLAWWNLGGWANTNHAIEYFINGAKTTGPMVGGKLTDGQTYHLKVDVEGPRAKCYLDGELMFDFTLPETRKVYFSSTINDETGELFVKVTNTTAIDQPTLINIANATPVSGEVTILTGTDGMAENNSANPYNVAPTTGPLSGISGNTISYTAPAFSFSILKVKVADVTIAPAGDNASEENLQSAKAEIKNQMDKLNFIHTPLILPAGTSKASITWTFNESAVGYATLGTCGWNQLLDVLRLPDGNSVVAGTLVGNVKFADGTHGQITYDVNVAPEDTDYGYLYCFMNSTKEITNFALGAKEDLGMKFNVILGGAEIFNTEELAAIEHGTRDAYLQKGQRADEYFITTTDMCNAKSGVWSNYGMNLIRSTDLLHWESTTFDFRKGKQIFSDPQATTDCFKTDAEYEKIYRVWAPQFIWDPQADAYLVYYSILSSNPGDNYDKIYYSYADKDFKTLTQPRLFFDPGYAVIDGDIVLSPYDGLYHMFYKREGAGGADRGIYEAVSSKLVGEPWRDILHVTNEGTELSEGSSAIRRINEDYYNLYYMRYTGGSAYKVCTLDHAGLNVSGSFDLTGTGNFQHGSIVTLNEKEYKVLEAWDAILPLIEAGKTAKESGSTAFDQALAQAENALNFNTIDALYTELPKAIEALKDAKEAYVASLINPDGETDLTSLIVNPKFNNGGNGWLGTEFTAANNGVAEHFNKTYDTYQVLERMPAGVYRLECQGFYRAGARTVAYAAHNNGKEALNALLYMNEEAAPFMSLFDETASYTFEPYTYPDNMTAANRAFNTNGLYKDNSVVLVLKETSDIRLGVKKSVTITSDWNCFDNFRLVCLSSDPNGIATTISDDNEPVDIYTIEGICIRKQVNASEAAASLPAGLYIIGHQKVLVK